MSEKAKVLVVDDDEIVRLSHTRTLSGSHCNVDSVWNGEQALRALEQERYDLILLDLRMPGMDGISVLKAIKQKWPESEVIVITGYPKIETAKQAVQLGAYDYLAKPVGPDEVIDAVKGAMLHKRWALRCEPPNNASTQSNSDLSNQACGR